ncbi:MAG: rod shape-determining protein [Candidatus Pacebacteria bacterium]|nr:rod shape-determining protein [Candidatus Paceibacterota bacterium]MDD3548673.1 rod shape-determining protein [Candidatus Paceibacterota bacterium]MDD4999187.1 rod shape-determining protein [Candidatus Paceibacterota bacterium]MDD5545310.1 rod shape-determining protein [Candidatus Paceibacterota bacterium]
MIRKIGIDLGTANTLVFIPQKGVVIDEPSVVAISLDDNKVLSIGLEAREMLGRTPEMIKTYKPLKDGVIADYRVTAAMLKYFIDKAIGSWKIFKPDLIISVPVGITSTERRAVISAAREAGAKEAYVAREPILAALGAGVPINSAAGNMIVNIGGGTTEVAVISLGGIVSWASVRVAGNKMDEAIADYIKRKYNLAIGERSAEEIKIKIGSALVTKEKSSLEIKGLDLTEGLPKNININSNEVAEAISAPLKEIIQAIKLVLSETPPELAADVMERGMIVSGGGALLKNINELITKVTGVPSYIADEPLYCVAKGTGVILDNLELYKKSITTYR